MKSYKGGWDVENNSFKVSAEILQRNATKSSIRDLNAEFQRMGGKVIHKASKKGPVFQLSHPDSEYLEKFRIRLFKELGLIEEKDVPEEIKEEPSVKPRYGDKHRLRRGWNVRSPKEFNEGIYNKEDKPYRQRWDRTHEPSEVKEKPERKEFKGRGPTPESRKESFAPRKPEPSPEIRVDPFYTELVKNALDQGAVDDGGIIKYAYQQGVPEERIRELKKMLWNNKCRGSREECPYKRKKFRFEDMMKAIYGKVDGWENIESPFSVFVDEWAKNIEEMYGPFRDKNIDVVGKVSSYKPVYRKNNEHLKMLVFDTEVKLSGEDAPPKSTRKLWVKIGIDEFQKLTGEQKVHVDDIVSFSGKCIFDTFFNDYWVVDLKNFKVLEEDGGELITVLSP